MMKVINPYAFVKLPDKKTVEEAQKGTLSGRIECLLYPRTPLFIPNTTNEKFFDAPRDNAGNLIEHKSYDFYSYNDLSVEKTGRNNSFHEPVIPGSSIRGEVRSLFEALTGSCMSTADNDLTLYKRLPDPGQLGVLKKEEGEENYKLYKAEKYMVCFKNNDQDSSVKRINGKTIRIGKNTADFFPKGLFSERCGIEDRLNECGEVWFRGSGNRYVTITRNRHRLLLHETVDEIATQNYINKTNRSSLKKKGYILRGEALGIDGRDNRGNPRKHHFSIAHIGDNPEWVYVAPRSVEALGQVLNLYADKRINQNLRSTQQDKHNGYSEYAACYRELLSSSSGKSIPVFFKSKEEIEWNQSTNESAKLEELYLSPSCITKEVYQNTILDLLKNAGLDPCTNITSTCPACRMFGMIGSDNENALSGRVRFSDARVEYPSNNWSELYEKQKVTLRELSSPKVSSTEFYLQPPDNLHAIEAVQNNRAHMWHYDGAFNWGRGNKREKVTYQPQISGRKFYWQHPNFNWANAKAVLDRKGNLETERNNTVRPLKPCAAQTNNNNNPKYRFTFNVYFERLTKDELNKLIAVLHLGGNGYHSIGHGKPYGMGSAKIAVKSVKLRRFSLGNGIIDRELIEYEDLKKCKNQSLTDVFGDKVYVKQVQTICALHKSLKNSIIAYPYVLNNGEEQIFKWFLENRANSFRPTIQQTLPDIPVSADGLPDKISLNTD